MTDNRQTLEKKKWKREKKENLGKSKLFVWKLTIFYTRSMQNLTCYNFLWDKGFSATIKVWTNFFHILYFILRCLGGESSLSLQEWTEGVSLFNKLNELFKHLDYNFFAM